MVAFIKSFRLAGKKEEGLAFEVWGLRLLFLSFVTDNKVRIMASSSRPILV